MINELELTKLIFEAKDMDLRFAHKFLLKKKKEYLNFVNKCIITQPTDKLGNKQIAFILSLKEALKQFKKASYHNIIINTHWYDDCFFDYSIVNVAAKRIQHNYPFGISFILLDERDNYRKIVDHKWKIRKNLKFSPSKIICLHWGSGCRMYINE